MSCSEIESVVVELSRDEPLEAGRLERVQAHLAACESCRRLVATHRSLADGLADARRADAWTSPPAEIEQRLSAVFGDQARLRARTSWSWAASLAAVAALAAFLIGSSAWERRPSASSAPQQAEARVTEFYPLAAFGPYDALDRGRLVRVRLPASAAFDLGIPTRAAVGADLLEADVFLGDDGVARAIRFVY